MLLQGLAKTYVNVNLRNLPKQTLKTKQVSNKSILNKIIVKKTNIVRNMWDKKLPKPTSALNTKMFEKRFQVIKELYLKKKFTVYDKNIFGKNYFYVKL